MSEIEFEQVLPIQTRTLVEMSERIEQLLARAEAAEKELAELKSKVEPLVDAVREALHLCQIRRLFTPDYHEIDKAQAATWLKNALKQWDQAQGKEL